MRLIGYVRVSRVAGREGDSFIAPDVQRDKIEGYARLHDHTIVDVLTELDASGGRDDRPLFQQALEAVEAGEADGIIVAYLSRFGRSMADAANAIRRIAAAGGELISVDDRWDTTTPMGKFGLHLTLALAELELDRVREGWAVAQERAVERGVHFASRGVFGYTREQHQPLAADPVTAPFVAEAFQARADGASYTEIAAMLDERVGGGPNGSPRWTAQSVKRTLGNRAYLGEARYGDLVRPDAHEPLVTEALFLAAQNGLTASPSRSDEGALLHGILRCAGCRHAMNRTVPRTTKAGESYREYRCRRRHSAGTCTSSGAIQAHVVEQYVIQQFFAALGPDGVLAARVSDDRALDAARADVEHHERELAAWLKNFSVAELGPESFREGLRARERRLDEARAARDQLASTHAAAMPDAVQLIDIWPDLSLADQRKILTAGVGAVFLRRGGRSLPLEERVHICWRGTEPGDLPRRGVAEPLRPYVWPDSPAP